MAVFDTSDPAVKLSLALNLVWGGADRVRPFFVETRRTLLEHVEAAVRGVDVSNAASAEEAVQAVQAVLEKLRADLEDRGEV